MFISEAIAQTTQVAAQNTPSLSVGIFQMVIIFVALYFILIRPQQKKIKKHEETLNAITTGSKVIIAGIVGTVTKVLDDQKLSVKISDDTQITVIRGYVSGVVDEK